MLSGSICPAASVAVDAGYRLTSSLEGGPSMPVPSLLAVFAHPDDESLAAGGAIITTAVELVTVE